MKKKISPKAILFIACLILCIVLMVVFAMMPQV